ncbi:TnsD family Tn7-like transposition protein [Neomegalonema perideroedes]|uniref:TnsD family Tn7-like transposition protein n=1 Tax=Neomegalonema perideroedes TaxID=217219 RepID=UPI0003750238|nr:TnsD family Tn7-like transposition protein [Neomegalonema perideroedes]
MLSYFPASLPDELLFSRIARYHLHICSRSSKQTLDDLFGDRSVRASVDLQCRLSALARRLPPSLGATAEDLAQATLFGYHAAFQPAGTRRLALRSMLGGEAAGLHARLGIAAGLRAPAHRLRWCAACHEEALAAYGEPYWRRAHQLPGALLCPAHGLPLRPAILPPVDQHGFLAATAQTCPAQETSAPDWARDRRLMEMLLALARRSAALLDVSPAFASFAELTRRCRARFVAAGFASPSGRLRVKALTDAAEIRLGRLQNLFPEARSIDWLIAMGRKHRHAFSPLQHLLLDLVLEDRAAPPPRRRPRTRRFLAEDVAFEERLRRAALKARSLREAARLLGVDPQTVLKHANHLRLEGPWVLKPPPEPEASGDEAKREEVRRLWLEIQRPGLSRMALRRERPALWVWLRRHDPEWLEANSPPALRRQGGGPRKDWSALDVELAAEIRAAVAAIRTLSPPRRVTRGEIERQLQRRAWFGPRLKKLPLCETALEEHCESVESFRLRRIHWARAVLRAQDLEPADWRIQRLAGLRKGDPRPSALSAALTKERTP